MQDDMRSNGTENGTLLGRLMVYGTVVDKQQS